MEITGAINSSTVGNGSSGNLRNEDGSEVRPFEAGANFVDVEGQKTSFVTDSSSATVAEGAESIDHDCGQEGLARDDCCEVPTARDVTIGVESSNGDPSDDFGDDNDFDDDGEEPAENLVSPRYLKIVAGVTFLIIILFVIIDAAFGENYVRQGITVFLEWIRQNPGAGVVVFILVCFVATIICVPGALLTIGAGFVFSASNEGSLVKGVSLGTFAVVLGSSLGALVAFLFARYLLYDRVRKLSQKYSIFEALDVALSEKGFRIMCLLRLSPITPFVLLNYIAGVTTVKLSSYMLSIPCILPGAILYAFLGASAGGIMEESENKTVTIWVVTVGVIFGVLAIALTSYYARKELNKEVDSVRSRLYSRTTSRRNRQRYRRNILRKQRARYRRRIDRKRAGRST